MSRVKTAEPSGATDICVAWNLGSTTRRRCCRLVICSTPMVGKPDAHCLWVWTARRVVEVLRIERRRPVDEHAGKQFGPLSCLEIECQELGVVFRGSNEGVVSNPRAATHA